MRLCGAASRWKNSEQDLDAKSIIKGAWPHTEAGAKAEAEANKREKTADFMVQLEYTDGKSDSGLRSTAQGGEPTRVFQSVVWIARYQRFNQRPQTSLESWILLFTIYYVI